MGNGKGKITTKYFRCLLTDWRSVLLGVTRIYNTWPTQPNNYVKPKYIPVATQKVLFDGDKEMSWPQSWVSLSGRFTNQRLHGNIRVS